jgi:hypothetical protein
VRWLLRFAIALAVPAIPCFAYYSLAYAGDASGVRWLSIVLAAPLALIGGIALIKGLLEPCATTFKLWLAALLLVVPVMFLLWIRA